MLQPDNKTLRPADWRSELARAIRDPAELLAALELPMELLPAARRAAQQFGLRVPRSFLRRIRRGDPTDPLLRQVLPIDDETVETAGYSCDPVGDLDAMRADGLLHKYTGRALLVVTGACGIHCRYCFRRHFPYSEANPAPDNWQAVMQYLHSNPGIDEVILSGGDPLTLADTRLARLAGLLGEIPHLNTLRIHTRLPVVLPSRVTAELLAWLEAVPLKTVVVTHINHANEIDDDVCAALLSLKRACDSLLNQSVLLRGVNDSDATLIELSKRLFDVGILPYYLHRLDAVQGAAHFRVEEMQAGAIMQAMYRQLPGYLVPRYVQDLPGSEAKLPVLAMPVE
jgi:EF-P beta-lysylation protein EpmB